jgi:hypothetical protein
MCFGEKRSVLLLPGSSPGSFVLFLFFRPHSKLAKTMIFFAVALLVAVANGQVYHTEQMDMNGMDNYVLQWGVNG